VDALSDCPRHSRSRNTYCWHLAGGVFRQRTELDLARGLEVREHGLAVPHDLLRRRLLSFGERDEGFRHSFPAPFLVGTAITCRLSTAGMAHHRLLTSMVLMFSPPETMMSFFRSRSSNRAVRVSHRQIPAVEPAAMERFRGRLRIAKKYPSMTTFPRITTSPMVRPSAAGTVVHLVIDDTHFAPRRRLAKPGGLGAHARGRQPLLAGRGTEAMVKGPYTS